MILMYKAPMGTGMTHHTNLKLYLLVNIFEASQSKLSAKPFCFSSYCREELKKVYDLVEKNNCLCKELFTEYVENGEENIDRIRLLNYQIFVTSKEIFSTKAVVEKSF